MERSEPDTPAGRPGSIEEIDLIEHIDALNRAGRLALTVYLVHGHPSVAASEAAFESLRRVGAIFECGLPVPSLSGTSASAAIVRAHEGASRNGLSDEESIAFYARYRPNLLLHVEDGRRGGQALFERVRGAFDAVTTDDASFEAVLHDSAMRGEAAPLLVRSVSALSTTLESDIVVPRGDEDTVIHLGVASLTGGELLPAARIQEALERIATVAPRARVLCGFGIRSAADATRVRRLRGVHGITVGTEALNRLEAGLPEFDAWLAGIDAALDGGRDTRANGEARASGEDRLHG